MMMKLRLLWTDPVSQRPRHPLLNTPVALGSTFRSMPVEISGKSVSRMVIGDRQVQDFHALLVEIDQEIYLIDNLGQTYINQQPVQGQAQLNSGDRIRIGSTEIQFQIIPPPGSRPSGTQTTRLQAIPGGLNQSSQSWSPNSNGNGRPAGQPVARASSSSPGNAPTTTGTNSTNHLPNRPNNGNHGSTNRPMHLVPDPRQTPDLRTYLPPHNSPQDPFKTHSQRNVPAEQGSAPTNHQPPPNHPMASAGSHSPTSHSSAHPSAPSNGHYPTGQNSPQNQTPGNNGYRSQGSINSHPPSPAPQPASFPTPSTQQQQPAQQQPALEAPSGFAAHHPEQAQPFKPVETPQSVAMQPAVPFQPNGQAQHSTGGGCRRIVGFLFKRECGRSESAGCSHCENGYSSQAYAADYELYDGFGRYGPGDWGYGLLANQNQT